MIWFLLQVVRGSSPASRAQSVQTLSKGDFTIVIWPGRQATPSHPQATARTSTGWPSTWLSVLWKRWPTWDTRGNSGAEDGTVQTPSTLNSQERANTPASKDGS